MSSSLVGAIEVGAWVRYDGDQHQIVAMTGTSVKLRHGLATATVLLSELVAAEDFRILADADGIAADTGVPEGLAQASVLDVLPEGERAKVHTRLDAVLLVRDGRLPDQPEDPELAEANLMERYRLVAERLDLKQRSLRRWCIAFAELGLVGLVDARLRGSARPTAVMNAVVREAIGRVLDATVPRSTPTTTYLIEQVRAEVVVVAGERGVDPGDVSDRTLRRYVAELSRGRGMHLSSKSRQSVANVPKGAWGRVYAGHLGDLVAIDATPLDCFAMDAVTGRWQPVHLLLALDVATRTILAWRFTPGDPTSTDSALLLRDIVTPKKVDPSWPAVGQWRYTGVPKSVVLGLTESDPLLPADTDAGVLGVPCVVPDAVVLDHGKVFTAGAFAEVCATLGISIRMARPYTPTDKAHVERVFHTIRTRFVQLLPGYKGPDVYSRGTRSTVEDEAFLFIHEINERFAAWVAIEYHNTPHQGLRMPMAPAVTITPNEAVDASIGAAATLPVPVSADLLIELLPTVWRTVRGVGVEVNGLDYDGDVLDEYRHRKSCYGEKDGKWRIKVDIRDLSKVWFFSFDTPDDPSPGVGRWVALDAKGWPVGVPFTDRMLAHAKRLALNGRDTADERSAYLRELHALCTRLHAGTALDSKEHKLAAHAQARATEAQTPAGQLAAPISALTGANLARLPGLPGADGGDVAEDPFALAAADFTLTVDDLDDLDYDDGE